MTANKRSNRKKNSFMIRPRASRDGFRKILIVCEGENTEPTHFKHFKNIFKSHRKDNLKIHPFGTGDPMGIIKKAKNWMGCVTKWCVFDKDSIDDDTFNSAIKKAEKMGLKVAYSNQSFEYWLLLHLMDHQGGKLDRNRYKDLINKELYKIDSKVKYEDDKKISDSFFKILSEKEDKAKQRAKRILENKEPKNPAKAESSTNVYKLVEDLRKEIKKINPNS